MRTGKSVVAVGMRTSRVNIGSGNENACRKAGSFFEIRLPATPKIQPAAKSGNAVLLRRSSCTAETANRAAAEIQSAWSHHCVASINGMNRW